MAIRNFCPACWPTFVAGPGGSTAGCTEWAYASPFTSSEGAVAENKATQAKSTTALRCPGGCPDTRLDLAPKEDRS